MTALTIVAPTQQPTAVSRLRREVTTSTETAPRLIRPLRRPSQLYGRIALMPWKMPRVDSSSAMNGAITTPRMIIFQLTGIAGDSSAGIQAAASTTAATALQAIEFESRTAGDIFAAKLAL